MSYYGLDARFVPVVTWPGKPTPDWGRKRAPFKATVGNSVALLKRELGMLRAKHVVIQMQCDETQIRNDGYPRADCKAGDGIIVTFDSEYGPLSYPCDTFRGWWNNLRAIALALEALRKVDRYGVTKRGEQYTGWKALPGGTQTLESMSAIKAAGIVAMTGGYMVADVMHELDVYRNAYRIAAKKLHPDVGGDVESFQLLQEAKRVLDLHFGLAN